MRIVLMLLVVLVALPTLAEDAPQKSLLILEFKHEAADATTARLLNDLVAEAAERHSAMRVITGADIKNVVALEAERESLGCDDTSASCLAEVAGALGAELVLFGNIGKLGEVFVVTLNLFNGEKAQSVGRETIRARDQGELPDLVDQAVGRLMGTKKSPSPSRASEPIPANLLLGGSLIGVGAVVGVAGLVLANGQNDALGSIAVSGADKQSAFVLGHVYFWAGVAGFATAAAGVALVALPADEVGQ